MNKTFYEVVPADVLPEVKEDRKGLDTIDVPAIYDDGNLSMCYFDFLCDTWRDTISENRVIITGWLRPLPPDTVVVSDLDAVSERVIRRLDEMGRKCNDELFGLPVSPDILMNTMKEAVKEILKQQDNG